MVYNRYDNLCIVKSVQKLTDWERRPKVQIFKILHSVNILCSSCGLTTSESKSTSRSVSPWELDLNTLKNVFGHFRNVPRNLAGICFGYCGVSWKFELKLKNYAFYAEIVCKHEPLLKKRKCRNRNIDVWLPTRDLAFRWLFFT